MAVILIEHNVRSSAVLHRIAVLDWGQVIKVGRPAEVWQDERVRAAYIGGVAT